jgi:hypothetical protein
MGWLYLQKKHNRIRVAGDVSAMGAPMPKSVCGGEDNQIVFRSRVNIGYLHSMGRALLL